MFSLKINKAILSAMLSMSMVSSIFYTPTVFAQDISSTSVQVLPKSGQTVTGSGVIFEKDVVSSEEQTYNSTSYNSDELKYNSDSTSITVLSLSDLKTKVADAIAQRTSGITFKYTNPTTPEGYPDVLGSVVLQAVQTAGHDYEKTTLNRYQYSSTSSGSSLNITYKFSYLETNDQVAQVKSKVDEILSSIIVSGMSDEQKELAINNWICKNVSYDSSYTYFDAYEALFGGGKTVCEGYSLLAYRMFTEAGLEARIITGTGNGGSHAWNMVKINGCWYHIDITWNDPLPDIAGRATHTYFNLDDQQIQKSGHAWDSTYYPASSTSYTPSNPNLFNSSGLDVVPSKQTSTLDPSQITVTNNISTADTVTISNLKAGDVITVYTKDGSLLAQGTASSSNLVITLTKQLSETDKEIKVSITSGNAKESNLVSKTYNAQTTPSTPQQSNNSNNRIVPNSNSLKIISSFLNHIISIYKLSH